MDLQTREEKGFALYDACQGGHVECARLLLKANAMPDLRINVGTSPLYVSSAYGHPECVRLMLEAKAAVDLTADGVSSLYIACQEGHLECAQLLLEAKAEVDVVVDSKDGCTPLIVAAVQGHPPVVRLLLAAKASTTVRFKGQTVLDVARGNGHAACVELLDPVTPAAPPPEPAPEAKPHVRSDLGEKLVRAGIHGDVALLKRLLKSRRSTSTTRTHDHTALLAACAKGHAGAVRVLLKAKASWTCRTEMGILLCSAPVRRPPGARSCRSRRTRLWTWQANNTALHVAADKGQAPCGSCCSRRRRWTTRTIRAQRLSSSQRKWATPL